MRLILIAFTTPCVYMYLIGAGVSASFNLAEWTESCRTVCAIWAVTFGFGLLLRLEYGN